MPKLNLERIRSAFRPAINMLFPIFIAFPCFANDESGAKLVDAIWKRDSVLAREFIRKKADLSYMSSTGLTPLIAAVRTQNLSLVSELTQAGANLNQIDPRGCLAIHHTKNESIQNVLKGKNSWNWHCDLSNEEDSYPEVKGCLSGAKAQISLARKINDVGLAEYKKGNILNAEGALRAASYLDCNYTLARLNLGSVYAHEMNYDFAITTLDEAFLLDPILVVKKLATDKDYSEFKRTTKFKFLNAWSAYARGKNLKPLLRAKLPLKIGNDIIDIQAQDSKKEVEYPIDYFLISKKGGKKFLFTNCRAHPYHYCAALKPDIMYDPQAQKIIVDLNCQCSGDGCDGPQDNFVTRVGIDLKTFKALDDEFSKEDPSCRNN